MLLIRFKPKHQNHSGKYSEYTQELDCSYSEESNYGASWATWFVGASHKETLIRQWIPLQRQLKQFPTRVLASTGQITTCKHLCTEVLVFPLPLSCHVSRCGNKNPYPSCLLMPSNLGIEVWLSLPRGMNGIFAAFRTSQSRLLCFVESMCMAITITMIWPQKFQALTEHKSQYANCKPWVAQDIYSSAVQVATWSVL